LVDEQNPENSMPYFPTEKDWSQTAQSSRIPLDEHFLGKFAVNSLHIYGAKLSEKRPWELRGYSNPNLIPVNKDGRKPFGQTDEDATPVQSGQPRWMNEMEEHITRLSTNDAHSAHGAATANA
jgi:hypothetical protein